jgi:chitodextrinase
VTGYRIYRNAAVIGTTTGTSFSDTGLSEYTTYTYRVAAYDAGGAC